MKKVNYVQSWFSDIWARRRWNVIVSLALVLLIATAGLWFPVKLKWKLVRSFRNFWRGVTEDWDDKWDTIEDMLGINGAGDGAKIAAACADCDVCHCSNQIFHKYNVADVKEIIREGGKTILEDVPPLFIDIRTEEDYIKGHIPEAINMPLAEDLSKTSGQ
ncbi:MAG: rhodanese-like domain-containing protein [Caldisericia bacterium]